MTWRGAAVSGSRSPIQVSSQLSRGAKVHGSRGMRMPRRAAVMTTASPMRAPNSDGNSGPSRAAVVQYGTIMASAAKIAKRQIARPSLNRFRSPKNRASRHTMNSGMSVPTMPWTVAAPTARSPR